jgi:dnd system-associated protein 4
MRRVRRPAQHEALMQRLSGEEGPFSTLAEVLTFAAGLGYAEGRRKPVDKTAESIDFSVFAHQGAEDLIDMLAAAADQDIAILGSDREDERLTVFEEFAHGGLDVLQSQMEQEEAKPYLDSLLTIIIEHKGATASEPDAGVDFDAVVNELTR